MQWCGFLIDDPPALLTVTRAPVPAAAGTPSARMASEDAWRYNEDADIHLLCLRLFGLTLRGHVLQQPLMHLRLGDFLPSIDDIEREANLPAGERLGDLVIDLTGADLTSRGVVRANVQSRHVTGGTLLDVLLSDPPKPLPFAALNKGCTSYADSFLVFKLVKPAPEACCPANVDLSKPGTPATRRGGRQYKNVAPAHQNLLAILIQSKLHQTTAPAEPFRVEYQKCIDTPIPFIFLLVTDACKVSGEQHLTWPYNGNGYFIGSDRLPKFYGEYLHSIRTENDLPRGNFDP